MKFPYSVPGGKVNSSTIAGNQCVADGGVGTRRSNFKDRRPIGTLDHSILWNNTPADTSSDWTGAGNLSVDPSTVTLASGADLSVATRTTSFKYDLNSNLVLRELPNNVSEHRNFDALNRLQSMEAFDIQNSLFDIQYSHDAVGNLRQMTDSVSGLHTIPSSAVWNWTYDDRYRLLSETCTAGGSPAREIQFDWDSADNRTAMRKYENSSLVSTTTYSTPSTLNHMTGWTCGSTNAVYQFYLKSL